jgi:DTW domain-containing protein YfiP
LAPRLNLETRVEAVIHYADHRRMSNSGRLIDLALANSAVHIRGLPGKLVEFADGRLWSDLMLFPGDNAAVLSPELIGTLEHPVRLLVPDGNWNQAAGAARREPLLANARPVRLPPGIAAKYRIRHHGDPAKLCTFEAIIRALGIIEGKGTEASLEEFFRIWVIRTLYLKGRMSKAQMSEAVPS